MRHFIVFILLTVTICGHSQKVKIGSEDVERIFRSRDSMQNFYLALTPQARPKGLIIILPGYGGSPGQLLAETDLPSEARRNGYLVVIPFLKPECFYTDSISQARLAALVPEVMKKYDVPKNKFVIGGHSAGGNGALLYAENVIRQNKEFLKPNLVFGVDPPLDMKRLWNSFEYIKRINYHEGAVGEATYFLDRLRRELGGTPQEKSDAYEKISSYYRDAKDGGKIGYLKSTPVRLYCDPDIQWYIENRRTPYEHLNISDLSACIVQLKLLGNNEAELITNPGKGFFAGGIRHPHGFTSLESKEFLQWVNQKLGYTN